MISAIVTSIDKDRMLVMPTQEVDLSNIVGKRIRYLDKNDKAWPGVVADISDTMLVIKFDSVPSGLGQGQIVDILEEGEDVNYKEENS